MNVSTKKYNLLHILLPCCLWLGVIHSATAQFYGEMMDSLEQERINKRSLLQANSDVQDRVDEKINEHRLLMLASEWWGVPTDLEQQRLNKATKSLYEPYNTSLENSSWRNRVGTFYRNATRVSDKQNLILMGWHPYWKGDTYKTYNYKLLTHLAYYGYELNPLTGGYTNFQAIHEFTSSNIIETAHLDSCKVLLTVSSRGFDNHEVFFTSDPDVRDNLIDSLRNLLFYSGADGLDLKFEEVPIEYKDHFIDFVKELSFAIREDNSNLTISMSVPIYDKDNVYDLAKLKPWIDFFVISGYNFHIRPTDLKQGPLAPLTNYEANIRGTTSLFEIRTNLAELLASPYAVANIYLEHEPEFEERLKDSLNYEIKRLYRNLEYRPYDLTNVLNTIKLTKDRNGQPLWMSRGINRLLRKTNCLALLLKNKEAANDDEGVGFFLFKPKEDTLIFKEYDLFKDVEINSEVDSHTLDIQQVVEQYKKRIGKQFHSSLVLGLPYHGAVWYKSRGSEVNFEGYMPYSEIIRLSERGKATVTYQKGSQSLEAVVRDSVGGVYTIYFDNSTSLGYKFDYAIGEELGGVAMWSLGADYAHTDLWATIEQSFLTKRFYNEETGQYENVQVEKGNKIRFTIQYLLKRFGNLIFATLFFITIFICISFAFSVLDWKVRDVLFYTGAFRIFYVVVFTIVLLLIGNWMGWFHNSAITFAIGTGLGLLMTWAASNLVQDHHEKLP